MSKTPTLRTGEPRNRREAGTTAKSRAASPSDGLLLLQRMLGNAGMRRLAASGLLQAEEVQDTTAEASPEIESRIDSRKGGAELPVSAREPAHVVRQRGDGPLQRKIIINGVTAGIDKTYLGTVKSTFGDSAVTIVEKMHNKGNPPDYSFDSWDKFRAELRIRTNAIKGMDEVHAGCCNYPSTEPSGYLNPAYWKRNGYMDFALQTPMPSNKEPSDAVEAIFASGAGTQLECLTMTVAIEYYSLLKGMGRDKFNKKFNGGAGLIISTRSIARGGDVVDNEYDNITATRDKLLPGDWVYFRNFLDYPAKHPGGFWRGENAIVMGADLYRGFGVSSQTEDKLNEELVKQYNAGLPVSEQKTKADLLAEGGGLQTSPVFRPNVKKLTK